MRICFVQCIPENGAVYEAAIGHSRPTSNCTAFISLFINHQDQSSIKLHFASFKKFPILKVLGMEQLPPPKQWRFARKRRRDSSSGEMFDGEAAEEKKDKKEEGEAEVV